MRSRALPLLTALALGGCAHAPQQPVIPQTVTITVTKYVPIDDALTEPCPIEQPKNRAVGEAFRVAQARGESLDKCANARLREIREVSHKGATKP